MTDGIDMERKGGGVAGTDFNVSDLGGLEETELENTEGRQEAGSGWS